LWGGFGWLEGAVRTLDVVRDNQHHAMLVTVAERPPGG
jgi:hypothetical protein